MFRGQILFSKSNLVYSSSNFKQSLIKFFHRSAVLSEQKLNHTKQDDLPSNKSTDKSASNENKDLRFRIEEHAKKANQQPDHDWIQFYKFNYIRAASMVTKAKIYQTGLVVVCFFDSMTKYISNEVPADTFMTTNLLTTGSLLFLVVLGQMARRIVGIAYYDPNHPKKIKIAHLTFFGRRQNCVVDLKDISALSDTNVVKDPLFVKLVMYIEGKNKTFFLASDRLATIDSDVYKKIFGSIE